MSRCVFRFGRCRLNGRLYIFICIHLIADISPVTTISATVNRGHSEGSLSIIRQALKNNDQISPITISLVQLAGHYTISR